MAIFIMLRTFGEGYFAVYVIVASCFSVVGLDVEEEHHSKFISTVKCIIS
jgi:hypothetical protein